MRQANYYDRIASIYDKTRWMTDGVAEEIADFIVELVGEYGLFRIIPLSSP